MTAIFRFSLLLLLFSGGFITAVAQQGIQPEDYYKTIFVSQTEISPDGNLLAFTRTIVVEEENKRHSEIWMQRLSNGQPEGEPFRFTDTSYSANNPRWSPDGTMLSINSRRGDNDNAVRFLRVTAPGGEAFQIEGVEGTPVWSPDGEYIAFVKSPKREEELWERAGWISPEARTNTVDSTRFDGRVITHINYKRDGVSQYLPHPSIEVKRQLYVVSADGGEAQQITDLDWNVSNPVWAANGSRIYFSADPKEDEELNTDFNTNLYTVDVSSGQVDLLLEMDGNQGGHVVSPDGRTLAFIHTLERGAPTDIFALPLGRDGLPSGSPQKLTADWDLNPGNLHFTPNNRNVRFTAWIGGNGHLFEVRASGGSVSQVTSGDRRLSGFSVTSNGRFMAYAATDAVTPAEVFVSRSDGSRERQITRFNEEWLSERTIMPAVPIHWTVEDGTEIEGWVIKPVGYEEGQSYPMVLKIHGGPHSAYGNTWFQTFHAHSARGMFVFYPNPRGSAGYGHEFMYSTLEQWGILDQEDFLTGIEAVLEAYPSIDPQRLGVSGGSYGGFMVNWLTSQFSEQFAAAVTSRSITNWESWYGTTDVPWLTEHEFGGKPWEVRELYRKLSPTSYVENVITPTLIIHPEEDWRTPIADAEQWFVALKKREVPVEFVRYPRSSHGLSRTGEPWLLVDRMERIISWMEYWLVEE